MPKDASGAVFLTLAIGGLGLFLFKHLSYPLFWQDEAETAVFAARIVEYGYPKVHGPRNVIYEFGTSAALGIDSQQAVNASDSRQAVNGIAEGLDAYIGTTWGQFYFAVPGVLWAEGVDDFYAKTLRVRLPFAVAGLLSIGVFAWAVVPIFRGDARRARRFAAWFFVLSAASISLLLHLREARYYSLLTLLLAAILWLQLRYVVYGTLGFRRYAVCLLLLLVALFNVFFSAYFIVVALLFIESLWRVWRDRSSPGLRGQGVSSLVPLLASAVCVAPLVVYFETFQIAAAFANHFGVTVRGFGSQLGWLAMHFVRHEFLLPAIGCRICMVVSERCWGLSGVSGERERRRVVHLLCGFALGYALIGCLNPLVYERYFIVLSPIVTLILLLDSFALIDAVGIRAPSGQRRRARSAVFAAIALITAATSASRWADVEGRLREIGSPYRGPVDYAVSFLVDRYPAPERLVIATNYENHPYIFYLGSRVIGGLSGSQRVAERPLVPDVVIPRRRWSYSLGETQRYLLSGRYRGEALAVRDIHYNNIPALSRSPSTPDPHHFETPLAERDAERLEIFVRIP